MSVTEFLEHVRAIVVEYAVGRVLGTSDENAVATGDRLDPLTSYYCCTGMTSSLRMHLPALASFTLFHAACRIGIWLQLGTF